MSLENFIAFYLTFGICMAVVIFILLIMMKSFKQDNIPWWSIIITTLTGFLWPIAICWMIYWNLEDSRRSKKNNKKIQKILKDFEEFKKSEPYFTNKVYNNMLKILLKLYQVPDLVVPTFRNSIQFEWRNSNGSYLEFEVYEDIVTMLVVPYEELMKEYKRFDLYEVYSSSYVFKLHEITDMNILLTDFLDGRYDRSEIKKIIKEERV